MFVTFRGYPASVFLMNGELILLMIYPKLHWEIAWRVRWMDDRGHRYLLASAATQSLLTAPERKSADISIVEPARPGFVGSMSRSNRASAGQHLGRGRAPNPGRLYVLG